jgi:hypothetical protein
MRFRAGVAAGAHVLSGSSATQPFAFSASMRCSKDSTHSMSAQCYQPEAGHTACMCAHST